LGAGARHNRPQQEGFPMAEHKPDQKCAHPSCHCEVPAGTKYCSDYCKKAPEVELHCNCPHTDCRLKG
jgi:hypothetical protein